MTQIPTLTTNRLVLRPFHLEDAARVQILAGAWEIADTTANMPHPYEDGMAERWIAGHEEACKTGEAVTLAVTLASTGDLVGAVGLTLDRGYQGELGYWTGLPDWGKGYCTEAARTMLVFAFDELNLQRIHARVFKRNPASARVLEKLGFSHEGTLRQHVLKWGKPEDVQLFGLLKVDYETTSRPRSGQEPG
jgi:RimJ/RimL family protein N-acetyltransferase